MSQAFIITFNAMREINDRKRSLFLIFKKLKKRNPKIKFLLFFLIILSEKKIVKKALIISYFT